MQKKLFINLLVLILVFPAFAFGQTKQKISLLLFNGKVFTADAQFTTAEAVAVDGEKIVAVGTTNDLKAKYQAAKEIDLQGKLVTPGFNDAHVHFLRGALSLLNVVLTDTKSLAEAQNIIAEKVKTVKAGEWIIGRGWDHTIWKQNFPTKNDLDKIAPNNPVFLVRVDGHVGWVNSAALKLAGITKDTKNPEGGEIERDASGEATGILKETSQNLVASLIPPPTKEQEIKGLELALDIARKYGITSVQDNSGYETTKLYREFLRADKLTVRVAEWQDFENSIDEIKRQRAEFSSFNDDKNRLKLTALKGYVDGTLGSRTASLLAPYSDDVGNSGIPRHTPEELTRMIVERDAAGFQIALHAIGDRANRMALDGFAEAKKNQNKIQTETYKNQAKAAKEAFEKTRTIIDFVDIEPDPRHRIEHAQVVNPNDFKRFEELGIIASMQPSHAISDKRWAGERLGEYRVLGAYAWHLMKSYNVHIPFGTDFPVESINPYRTLYAAVSRQDEAGMPAGGWQPQERLTIRDAIRCHTYESAYAEFAENIKGEIKVGMLADLVVQSKDLLTIEPKEILTTEPIYTILGGKIVYVKK
ncbi:MAG: amidohydrolase [Acidobacteriota bacterium]|nr:amidohydrolase [Acidobacteriota bacterium]